MRIDGRAASYLLTGPLASSHCVPSPTPSSQAPSLSLTRHPPRNPNPATQPKMNFIKLPEEVINENQYPGLHYIMSRGSMLRTGPIGGSERLGSLGPAKPRFVGDI